MWGRGIVGIVFALAGIVWVLQGIDVLHGSGMSGQGRWAVIGGVVLALGLALLAWAWRLRRPAVSA